MLLALPITIHNNKNSRYICKEYHNFIGINIGKFNFIVAIHKRQRTKEYENNDLGIDKFIKDFALNKDFYSY
jgi:hypothetical protein